MIQGVINPRASGFRCTLATQQRQYKEAITFPSREPGSSEIKSRRQKGGQQLQRKRDLLKMIMVSESSAAERNRQRKNPQVLAST
jgi:hypothetical protein